MAILSNGKFSGFLCSVRDTGRKLANGAKVMVEDFISGFNGHGWKLWKRDNSWRLEVDELLVRKSFTAFEMIISQITAIRGSQAITQGNGKIKSVTLVSNADVYKEISEPAYNNNFLEWYNALSTTGTATKDKISVTNNNSYGGGIYVTGSNTINAFKIRVENFTNPSSVERRLRYNYYNEDGELSQIFISENGEYELPASAAPPEDYFAGFAFDGYINFDITQISERNDYSDSIVREPCYRLELEESLNTFKEYDFIRCQKGNKFYHVQIGSIFQYYINVPISEFESDSETGEIMNAPQAGDEIVQFGNASHQEKYANRHSAIYLHLDENEPAIDLMTDIYSKDWSNVIKVRVGGNLPGTDGDRGFYAVNGKLLFVDENSETISVINPDGSASFAKGKLSWTKDGSPTFSGNILLQIDENNIWKVTEQGENIIGNIEGRKIVISPINQSIKIFNDQNENVISLDGTKKEKEEDFFGTSIPTITVKNIPFSLTTSINEGEVLISDIFYTDGVVNVSVEMQTLVAITKNNGYISGALYLDTYSDRSMSSLIKYDILFDFNYNVTGNSSAPYIWVHRGRSFFDAGYHVFRLFLKKDTAVSNLTALDFKYNFTIDKYLSNFFANGMSLGTSSDNYFYILNKPDETGLNFENIYFGAINPFYGIKLDVFGIYSKINNKWGCVPSIIACGYVFGGSSYSYRSHSTFDRTRLPNIIRLGVGLCRITFPESWSSLNIGASNAYVMLTGAGYSLEPYNTDSPIKATFKQWAPGGGFDVWLSDDATANDGDFIFEVKWLS